MFSGAAFIYEIETKIKAAEIGNNYRVKAGNSHSIYIDLDAEYEGIRGRIIGNTISLHCNRDWKVVLFFKGHCAEKVV